MAKTGELRAVLPAGREPEDRELLRAALAGSERASEALVARHWDRAYRIAFAILGDPHLAEDVTQEAMISILANLGRLDPRRPFEPWLHRVVGNRALDWARARARREALPHLVAPPVADRGSDPDLVEALAALPPERRAVVVLRHVAGYGPEEIGRILGIRRGTVGSRLRRGLDELRTELEGGEDG
jgi:RNA polymerase sigma-70 factor, ECF subfamily